MESAPHHASLETPLRGFTLVEMLVVLAIIVIITMIALLGQSSFNRSLVLTDTAYTVAFSIREAQSYGLSSRLFGTTQNAGYGVHFATGAPTSYSIFADVSPVAPGDTSNPSICPGHPNITGPEAKPGNCIQDSPSEVMRSYSLNNGFRIAGFCGTQTTGGTVRCQGYLDALDIVYLRPNTQSVITGVRSGTRISLSDATIRIASPDGTAERCVLVSKVGQVSVVVKGSPECP